MAAGRLGNVTAALLPGDREESDPAEVAGFMGLVDALFEETLLVGRDPAPGSPGRRVAAEQSPPGSPLGLLSDAFAAASAERLLVIPCDLPARVPAHLLSRGAAGLAPLLLALTAWPAERGAIGVFEEGSALPLAALYDREPVQPILQRELAAGRSEWADLLAATGTPRVTLAELFFGDSDRDDSDRADAESTIPEGC